MQDSISVQTHTRFSDVLCILNATLTPEPVALGMHRAKEGTLDSGQGEVKKAGVPGTGKDKGRHGGHHGTGVQSCGADAARAQEQQPHGGGNTALCWGNPGLRYRRFNPWLVKPAKCSAQLHSPERSQGIARIYNGDRSPLTGHRGIVI